MNAAALFRDRYRLGHEQVDLNEVRLHATGGDRLCRSLGAQAVTIGSDVYFRDGAFAPHTPVGLWLLAHEMAHVVQQRRGVTVPSAGAHLAVAPADSPEEREADAAADAFTAGRVFVFEEGAAVGAARGASGPIAQRYMAWEHALLGDLTPELVGQAAGLAADGSDPARRRTEPLELMCSLLEALGRDPLDVDVDALQKRYPEVETIRLPGSGLVVTLGELNILPDYVSHPRDVEQAPAAFLVPLVQSVRSWNISELRKLAGKRRTVPKLPEALSYPRRRRMTDIHEAIQIDKLGSRCGLEPWQLYSSVVSRNAAHFAPMSWLRWQRFHLSARTLIEQAQSADGAEREILRTRARIHAGYADHFLHDSFAAGHLINKTLVMQWFIDWLGARGVRYADRDLVGAMTVGRQPLLHSPGSYAVVTSADDVAPQAADPQTALEYNTRAERMTASGIVGATEDERAAAYAGYLAMLGSSVVQLAAGVTHGHLNAHSLRVAAGAEGEAFRLYGDHTLLLGGEGAHRAARAAELSRQAIRQLLDHGVTAIEPARILGLFPDRVEVDGALVSLPGWHASVLPDLCADLFGRPRTRFTRTLISLTSRRLGVASPDCVL